MNLDQRLLRLARQSGFPLALTIGLGFAAGVLVVLQARCLSRVIHQVFLAHQTLAGVAGLLAVLLAIFLARAGLTWGSEVAANAIAARSKDTLRRQLFQHLQALGPSYAGGERTGELASVAVEGIEALDAYYSQYLPQLVLAALVPFTYLCFVLPLDLLSGVVLLVTAPLIPIFMLLIGGQAAALTRRQWLSLSRMSAYFLDVLQGLVTLKILGRSKAQVQVIAQVSERFRQATMSVLRVTFLSALALELVATLSTAVVAVEVGLRLLYGRLAFEQALFVLLLAPEFYLPLRLLGARFHAGMSGVAAARRIFAILEAPVASKDEKQADQQADRPALHAPFPICFEDVHLSYGDGRPALKGVNFRIEAGQKVALVGPSGAGKSSIAGLLLRFVEPARGRITIAGKPLDALTPEAWRSQVAWVSQNPYLFFDTVAANIRLGCLEAGLEQVIQAAKLAHADEFIRDLPQGYDTLIGERGARLSAGQAQRIALARAFLKDAPLLILDEASANLDPEHEALLEDSLERLLQGRSALIIAHRLGTVVRASQILVLDAGCISEIGVHGELMKRNGLYKRLVEAYSRSEEEPARPAAGGLGERLVPQPVAPAIRAGPAAGLDWSEPGCSLPGEHLPRSFVPRSSVPRSSVRHSFLRLLGFVSPFKGLVALSVLAGVATIGSGIGLMMASAFIISAAALQPSIAVLQVAIVGVRFFGVSRGLFRYLERMLAHQVTFRILARLRVWFYRSLEPLAPARLAAFHSGDLLARILGDIEALESFYVRVLSPPLVAGVVALGMAAYLARYDLGLAAALLACLCAAGVGAPLLARLSSRDPGRRLVSQRAALNACLVDGIQGMADLQAFGREKRQSEQIQALSRSLAGTQQELARIGGLQSGLTSLFSNLGLWAVLVLATPLVESGRMDGVYLAVLALGALASFEAVLPLPVAAQTLESSLEAARRLFDLVDTRPEVQNPARPRPLPQDYGIEVTGLWFRYGQPTSSLGSVQRSKPAPYPLSPHQPYVLEDLNFSLPQGKRLAIVGPSGAGKSTLVSLLLRFWDYSEGEISLGGHDLRQYDQEALRSCFGVVAQKTFLFNASVRENLLLARPEASQAELVRAAELAQIHEFIQSLPQGYDTWIGEQGLRLSAGERQRLAIARALLKDAPVLILDEATANLDALAEREVLGAIHALMDGRTTLMITHRLVGLEAMDEILVMQNGRVVERGRHAGLLAQCGLYCRMWELQNQVFPERVL